MAKSSLSIRIAVLVSIAIIMTVGVYGFVAAIVKLDDAGLYLTRLIGEGERPRLLRALGRGILRGAPFLMKGLSIAGTVAMFLVGGGIVTHGVGPLHALSEALTLRAAEVPGAGGIMAALVPSLFDGLVGIIVRALILAVVSR